MYEFFLLIIGDYILLVMVDYIWSLVSWNWILSETEKKYQNLNWMILFFNILLIMVDYIWSLGIVHNILIEKSTRI